MNEYKALIAEQYKGGLGIDVHCHDVGLEDPSTTAGMALNDANKVAAETGGKTVSAPIEVKAAPPTTYEEWIVAEQAKRNSDWKQNVLTEAPADTEKPMKFEQFSLF